MSIRKIRLIATAGHARKRLDHVLAAWLPEVLNRPVSNAKVRKLIMAGAVLLNGKRVRIASMELTPGANLDVFVDTEKLFEDLTSRDRKFELTAGQILFEDEDLIVVDKPPGIPAQPTLDETRDNLFAAVHRFFSKRDGGESYVGVHQRLDRDTSGVVLFTKSLRVNSAIAEVFSRHQGVKIYQALTTPASSSVGRKLQNAWTIKNYLGKVSTKSKRAKYGAVPSDGDAAETSFRVIERHSLGTWIEATPKTGRTHQIRIHLSEYGLPILGDDLYGADRGRRVHDELASRLMLHASQLIFVHPVSGLETSVKSPLPEDFKRCLNRLGPLESAR